MARLRTFPLVMGLLAGLGVAFMLLPLIIIIATSIGTDSYLRFPPRGLTFDWYERLFRLTQFTGPLLFSLQLATAVAFVTALSGGLAGFSLKRSFAGAARGFEVALLTPVLLPTLIIGVALLLLFSAFRVENSAFTLGLGQMIVTLPFVVQTSLGLTDSLNPRIEQAAMTLGARPATVFLRVVLPALRPGIVAGAIIAFALSFDEFVISVLLARPGTITLPVELFQYMRFSINPVVAAISTLLIGATFAVVVAFHAVVGVDALFGLARKRR